MKKQDFFGNAIWVTGTSEQDQPFYILRGKFTVKQIKKAQLNVLGLGIFCCYINGKRISEDEFLPLSTDYEKRDNWPIGEQLTGHRIYVPRYDVTEFLKDGENCISLHFGGGWYTLNDGGFGHPKAIWNLVVQTEYGEREFGSSERDKIFESYISNYRYTSGVNCETQDLRLCDINVLDSDYDDSSWENVIEAQPLDTEYMLSECPADRLREELPITKLEGKNGVTLYDIGKNCSAIPFIKILASEGERVVLEFYEQLTADGRPDEKYCHEQCFEVVSDGNDTVTRPIFNWFTFQYFTIAGNAEPVKVNMLCTDIAVSSNFRCDNDVLNWLYEAFITTQLSNMHTGIPSDCPHIERRGYTGDGQLICHAAMNMLAGESFYRKWIGDISDCQDTLTGHVQYTAPYTRSGGGPGGWGCAVIEVPYQFYKHYGEKKFLKDMYWQMLRYFDYLEAHSRQFLVVSDKEGEWCLGDWCTPDAVVLPAPFVNNYFYIKCLYRMIEIAKLIDKEEDILVFEQRMKERKTAVMNAYFNKWDGNFLGNVQGANAFAVDIGLGDARTYENLVQRYDKLEEFDTGIFGTDILIRVLFENGDGDVAVKLLKSEKTHTFGGMRNRGATSLWEYWPESLESRSLNHPMFGAVCAYLFDFILGIGQEADSCAYENIVIAPVVCAGLSLAEGYRTLPCGKVSVKWEKQDEAVKFTVHLPEGVWARFRYNGVEKVLNGESIFYICS